MKTQSYTWLWTLASFRDIYFISYAAFRSYCYRRAISSSIVDTSFSLITITLYYTIYQEAVDIQVDILTLRKNSW